MDDDYAYIEKSYGEQPDADRTQIEKRLAELDLTIDRLQHQAEMIEKRMRQVVRPAEPSDPSVGLTEVARIESPLAERVGNASRRIENVASHLADLASRCDL